jgi:hypothetical protein
MDDFIPSDLLKRIFRFWWILALIMIAGGGVGYVVSRLQTPVYESQASITTSIDFAYTDRLSEDQEDYMINTVGDVIDSSQVFELVKEQASSLGLTVTDDGIKERFTKSRQGYRWELTVRDTNPEVAQTLTQLWVVNAGNALAGFHEETLDAVKYHSAEISLQNCFSQIVVVEPASAYCSMENLDEIRDALKVTTTETDLSTFPDSLLLSKISTEISDNAYLPSSPIEFKRNYMVLAGAMCGLLIGLLIFIFGKSK